MRADYRRQATCLAGGWLIKKMDEGGSPDQCDFSQPPAGQLCPTEGVFCVIGQTQCACSACLDGPCQAPPLTWQCAGPPTTPGCPALLPNDGTVCDAPGVQCTYGFPCAGAGKQCGDWGGPCPGFGSGAQVTCNDGLWLWAQNLACAE